MYIQMFTIINRGARASPYLPYPENDPVENGPVPPYDPQNLRISS